jgi:hypothetical protein
VSIAATEIEALGRALASEASSHTEEERRAIGWAIRNMSAKRRRSIYELGGSGTWGAQGEAGRPFSTRADARTNDRELATQVLLEAPALDPTRGATAFFEPALQNQFAKWGALYRANPKAYPQHMRFRLYKSDAAALRQRWQATGMSPRATVGRWEFWRDGGAGDLVADARQTPSGGGGGGGAIVSLLLWALFA